MKALFLVLVCVYAVSASAQWSANSAVNTPICLESGTQVAPAIASDGSGGAIITWRDNRTPTQEIYVQRVSAGGVVQWTQSGVLLRSSSGTKVGPAILSDKAGGAIIAWLESDKLYAQRVNAAGTVLWNANGLQVCNAGSSIGDIAMVTDGADGAIITWVSKSVKRADVMAQRIDGSGKRLWDLNANTFCKSSGKLANPSVRSDGEGGAIAVWQDERVTKVIDIYAERINGSGQRVWDATGVAVCTADGDQEFPTITLAGSGGLIACWQDKRNGNSNIYAQKLNGEGAVQWAANGIAVCTENGGKELPQIVGDGSSGAIIAWMDSRVSMSNMHLYAQKVDASGIVQWAVPGVPICTAQGRKEEPIIAADGAGGAIVAWLDRRNGVNNSDLYAQRVSSSGQSQWGTNGAAIGTDPSDQWNPSILADNVGGAIFSWASTVQSGYFTDGNIVAQNVWPNGSIGPVQIETGVNEEVKPLDSRAWFTTDRLCVQFEQGHPLYSTNSLALSVFDVTGSAVRKENTLNESGYFSVDIADLRKGAYVLVVQAEGSIYSTTFIHGQ